MANVKKAGSTPEEKKVVKKEETPLALFQEFEGLSGQGFEDTDKDAFAIPFLRILQSNSPQVNEDEPAYIKGSKPGMFFNTITGDLFGKSVMIIPVHYMRDFVEWAPNRGGFIKSHGPNSEILQRVVSVDDKNNQILDNGNIIQDTRNHYVLVADQLEMGPIIFSLTSTGIRHSRKWMSLMNNLRIPNSKTQAPMFAGVWDIATIMNENDEGKWYQVGNKHTTCINFLDWVTKDQLDAAVQARELLKSGNAKADYESTVDERTSSSSYNYSNGDDVPPAPGGEDGEDIPF